MFRLLLCLLAALFLSGCFVLEEMEKGDALIEQHSVGWRKMKQEKDQKEQAAKEEAAKTPSLIDPAASWSEVKLQVQEWWQAALEEESLPPDSNDAVIRCEIRGQVRFTRKSDCTIRGGRAMELSSNQK